MKKVTLLLPLILATSHATNTKIAALYGGCLNKLNNEFVCHLTSEDCREGEKWLTPHKTKKKGYKCTCDDDYRSNVHVTACYALRGDHKVRCAADRNSCDIGEDGMDIVISDGRMRIDDVIPDDCGHGSEGFGDEGRSCGKQCRCSFDYQQDSKGTTKVEIGSTRYGGCYNPDSGETYCVANSSSCRDGEEYRSPRHKYLNKFCPCSMAAVGACVNKKGNRFKQCAVSADSCIKSWEFIDMHALRDSKFKIDCNLCLATWNTPPPTSAPTRDQGCVDSLDFRYKGKEKKSCSWVDDQVNNIGSNICDKGTVKENCPVVCRQCCTDDYSQTFQVEGLDEEKTCFYLESDWPKDNLKKEMCPKSEKYPNVQTICPQSCGRCCTDDLEYEFKDINFKVRKCSWLEVGKRAEDYCQNDAITEKCVRTCDNCNKQYLD